MLSDGVILLHDNTHTVRKTEELLRDSSRKSGATPYSPDSVPNLGSKHLSGKEDESICEFSVCKCDKEVVECIAQHNHTYSEHYRFIRKFR
ncbi:hypothetical protein AVEN_54187-1 [Araneus ventricosus]|uniref:Uncharacterized protein n=1 Tax=Araneus ventricosus TaxID=182803 RepID=A0A4Y2V3M3_ARAVE|nr:hypothetical protein AVEN_54187-1 [Araneus ventricosus]